MYVCCLFVFSSFQSQKITFSHPALSSHADSITFPYCEIWWILVYEMRTIVFFHKHADTLKKMLHIQTVYKRSACASWCGFWGGGWGGGCCCIFKPAKLIWSRSSDCYDSTLSLTSWLCPEARPLWSVLMIIMLNWRLKISKEITVDVKKMHLFIWRNKMKSRVIFRSWSMNW